MLVVIDCGDVLLPQKGLRVRWIVRYEGDRGSARTDPAALSARPTFSVIDRLLSRQTSQSCSTGFSVTSQDFPAMTCSLPQYLQCDITGDMTSDVAHFDSLAMFR